MQPFAVMRTLLLAFLIPACTDETPRDAADIASDQGEQLGETRADQVNTELATDTGTTVLAKSGAIMLSIDQGEVELADVALDFAIDPAVRGFAQRMYDSHLDHMTATSELLASLAVDPQATRVSFALDAEAQDAIGTLQTSGDFDFDYMRMMVSMHAEAIVIVGELADQQTIDVAQRFFADATLTIADHHAEASVILRGL
jgi:predicted outer membrane protein